MNKKINIIILLSIIFQIISCSEKSNQKSDNFNSIKSATNAIEKSQKSLSEYNISSKEAKRIYSDRVANGDTLAMNFKDLQKYLIDEIEGMKPDGDPNGSSNSVMGFSMSNIEREWKLNDSSFSPRIHITITDIGGNEGSYQLLAMPLILNMSSKNNNKIVESFKEENQTTFGFEEYDNLNNEIKITIFTRYRFLIKINSKNFKSDVSTKLKNYGLIIANKFEQK